MALGRSEEVKIFFSEKVNGITNMFTDFSVNRQTLPTDVLKTCGRTFYCFIAGKF